MRFGAAMTGALAGLQCLVAFSAFAEADQTHPETVWPTTSWMVSTAEEQGLDSGSLARLVETVGGRKQDSLLVIRHGKIVAEDTPSNLKAEIGSPTAPVRIEP